MGQQQNVSMERPQMSFVKVISGLSRAKQETAIEELLNTPIAHNEIEHSAAFTLQASVTFAQPIHVDDVHIDSFQIGSKEVSGTFRYFASGKQQVNKPKNGRGLFGLGDFTIDDESVKVTNLSARINFGADDDGQDEPDINVVGSD
jgi:hypothetical protein